MVAATHPGRFSRKIHKLTGVYVPIEFEPIYEARAAALRRILKEEGRSVRFDEESRPIRKTVVRKTVINEDGSVASEETYMTPAAATLIGLGGSAAAAGAAYCLLGPVPAAVVGFIGVMTTAQLVRVAEERALRELELAALERKKCRLQNEVASLESKVTV